MPWPATQTTSKVLTGVAITTGTGSSAPPLSGPGAYRPKVTSTQKPPLNAACPATNFGHPFRFAVRATIRRDPDRPPLQGRNRSRRRWRRLWSPLKTRSRTFATGIGLPRPAIRLCLQSSRSAAGMRARSGLIDAWLSGSKPRQNGVCREEFSRRTDLTAESAGSSTPLPCRGSDTCNE